MLERSTYMKQQFALLDIKHLPSRSTKAECTRSQINKVWSGEGHHMQDPVVADLGTGRHASQRTVDR